ncbi:heavy-metal-associated domain-containing protein [Chitinophaga japonensis]|uniref:Copper chaperone CopZ n=1 Tax=Chitinophaga japonensis TaxID=104662 RepID=A0A562SMS0_CHIJA|nr:heavy metal-associated domain-containing protein [Chitinophaga japonensis]TWI82585.1 copper chaperone CopZ [Chitinophaga japonensis]
MLTKKSLVMKLFCSFVMLIAFVITSCAQEQKKPVPKEQTKPKAAKTIQVPVDGMVCSACQSNVKKIVKSLDGIKDVKVSLEKRNAIITYFPNLIKPEQIQKAINDKGYTAGKPQAIKQ